MRSLGAILKDSFGARSLNVANTAWMKLREIIGKLICDVFGHIKKQRDQIGTSSGQ